MTNQHRPAMATGNPDWILVDGGDAAAIARAVAEHSFITTPEVPGTSAAAVYPLGGDRFAVTVEPMVRPYVFCNVLSWLHGHETPAGRCRAVGWLTSPGSGERYFLAPPWAEDGDTLLGVAADGTAVSVFLPDLSVSLVEDTASIEVVAEPELRLHRMEPAAEVEFAVDLDDAFGNPSFEVG